MIPASSALAWRDETDRLSWRSLRAAHFLTGPDGADLWYEALLQDLSSCRTPRPALDRTP